MTLTVTQDNLPQIADVVRWTIANRDAFSLISFQPLAQVGRTRKTLEGVTPQELWTEVGKATRDHGLELGGTAPLHFGHPDCTRFVPLVAVETKRGGPTKLMQLIRDHPDDIAMMSEFFDARPRRRRLSRRPPARSRRPRRRHDPARAAWFFGRVRRWVERAPARRDRHRLRRAARAALTRRARVDGLTLTSHHFMAPAELATENGQARLDACVFRLPYRGEMIPMCQMNAGGVRERLYADIVAGHAVV